MELVAPPRGQCPLAHPSPDLASVKEGGTHQALT